MSSGLNKNCLWNHWIFIFNCGAKYTVCLPLKALRHFDLKWWILEEPRDWVFLDDWEIIQYLGQCPRDGLVKNQFPPWSLPWRNISERVLFLCSDFIEGAMLQQGVPSFSGFLPWLGLLESAFLALWQNRFCLGTRLSPTGPHLSPRR